MTGLRKCRNSGLLLADNAVELKLTVQNINRRKVQTNFKPEFGTNLFTGSIRCEFSIINDIKKTSLKPDYNQFKLFTTYPMEDTLDLMHNA